MDKFSYIANADTVAIESMYQAYKENPESVDATWQQFFQGFDFSLARYGENNGYTKASGPSGADFDYKEVLVYRLIRGYRSRAHLKAKTNPVRERKNRDANINLSYYGLTDADLDKKFKAGKELGLENASLRDIISTLETIYEGSFGFEYMYIRQPEILSWMQTESEKAALAYNPTLEIKRNLMHKLNQAVLFENFLATKYIGQKRFGLEGGEATIVALDTMINVGSLMGLQEVVIGMAHRGRLNVLCNIMGKTYEQIFNEFEGNVNLAEIEGNGDVKYHMGYASEIKTMYGKHMHLKLMPNPSHLEAVDPLVLGYTRAQIEDEYRGDYKKAMAILIHGDAAVAGQGVVYETVQMANLPGYTTGGTIHFVINNQVGFTTDFDDARSSIYCTDVAKIIDAPVIHVNGDDVMAVAFAAKTAVDYRQLFGKDFFIDMVCYRRNGHNESDEPRFTQPKLYSLIAKHPNVREIFKKELIEREAIDGKLVEEMEAEFKNMLQDRLNKVKEKQLAYKPQKLEQEWETLKKARPTDFDESPNTAISTEVFNKIADALTALPHGFKPIKQIENLIKERSKMFFEEKTVNWASAELLAYGSLLLENKIVRMTGQDVKRGTFSHRHAVIMDSETNEGYCQINHIEPKQKEQFRIFNSLLSEFGVLGFEYGYAMATPHALVIWEAQFGDFSNGAQTMIDQFISSAETKWQRQNGLVLLLPHGYEGQGPEHSSARPERFLQLAAENNMIVANLTTSANIFHIMRRQLTWEFRKPCVIMSPKSLLRHQGVVSPISEFTKGKFRETYDDTAADPKKVTKVVLCTGKVYFDILAEKQAKNVTHVALIRVEQLYPFPEKQIDALLKKYSKAKAVWVQEEPINMGYWDYITRIYPKVDMDIIARKPSSSPATGYAKMHAKEQAEIVGKALE